MEYIFKADCKFLIVGIIMFFNLTGISQSIEINDVYRGRNRYVQNPFAPRNPLAPDYTVYCTNEVYLNGVKVMENIRTTAYEIDLSSLKIHDSVNVVIKHKAGCKPMVLPAVGYIQHPKQFSFSLVSIENDNLSFSTKGETAKGSVVNKEKDCLPGDTIGLLLNYGNTFFFELETKRGWKVIGSCFGKESPLLNNYNFKIPKLDVGVHQLRIKWLGNTGVISYSKPIKFIASHL